MLHTDGISRRQFVRIGSGAAAAGIIASLAGCSGGSNSSAASASASASSDASSASSTSSAAVSSSSVSTQSITDLGGDTVEVPTDIDTIVDLWHAHNQIVLMLGAGDKLVGTTENFKKMPWANVVYPKLANVEALVTGSGAGEVNYEEAISLEPDVVFTSDPDVTSNARKQGLTTVNVMFQDYDGLRDDVKLTAQILGDDAEDLAKEWEDLLDENIDLVASRMAGVSDADKVKVLHIVGASQFNMVDGTGTIVDEWIKLAGGVNAISTSGNRIELTEEEIIGADPDVIIIGSGTGADTQSLMSDSAWSGVTAVKNGAVYANPSGVFPWDRYSGEEALQVLWAAKQLNPDLFSDIDMEEKTRDFYMQFYGYDLTDDEVSRILAGEKPAS